MLLTFIQRQRQLRTARFFAPLDLINTSLRGPRQAFLQAAAARQLRRFRGWSGHGAGSYEYRL